MFDGRRVRDGFSFKVGGGHNNNIKSKATAFLGSTIGHNSRTSQKIASKEILDLFSTALTHLDCAPIRGDYKIWIYQWYLVPSLHYKLAVIVVAKTTVNKMNAMATKYVKRWLGLTRSTSVAIIHHLAVLDIPFLQEFRTKAKLSYLSAATLSANPLIAEISSLALRDPSEKSQCISPEAITTFSVAKRSVASITRKTLPKAVCILHKENVIDHFITSKLECPKQLFGNIITRKGQQSLEQNPTRTPCRPTIFPPVGRL